MRDKSVQKDSMRFRRNLERLGEIFAYEISHHLDYSTKEVVTPLGIANVPTPDRGRSGMADSAGGPELHGLRLCPYSESAGDTPRAQDRACPSGLQAR